MRKLAIALSTGALMLTTSEAYAQSYQFKDACTRAVENFSPKIAEAACDGTTGYCGCGPGWISRCAPRCCRCVPC
ncbi:MAG TPA: hypothetical protein VEH76_02805 [Methylocystis sp.]|nr:hypothetical protein [Methylocystis sp.]